MKKTGRSMKIRDMTMVAVMAAVISVCSWISVPAAVPFTMQTFGIFAALLFLGGRCGTAAVGLYIFLGIIGVPVFSGFQGGIGHIIGPTGGYIIGFLFMGAIYTLGETHVKSKGRLLLLSAGMLLCYFTGTLWFMVVSTTGQGFAAVVAMCVLPYMIPDAAKLLLAWKMNEKLKKHMKLG